ncbi:MAG: hypothetical protein KIT17_01130 [Rubrivivax sp.]|nr:hypothetical protein [Rubrivivax sp.]
MPAHEVAGQRQGSAGSTGFLARHAERPRQFAEASVVKVECPAASGTATEWAMLRAVAASTCCEAAFVGYASYSFGPWTVSAQRCGLPDARGRTVLLATLLHGLQRQAIWRAVLDTP